MCFHKVGVLGVSSLDSLAEIPEGKLEVFILLTLKNRNGFVRTIAVGQRRAFEPDNTKGTPVRRAVTLRLLSNISIC